MVEEIHFICTEPYMGLCVFGLSISGIRHADGKQSECQWFSYIKRTVFAFVGNGLVVGVVSYYGSLHSIFESNIASDRFD